MHITIDSNRVERSILTFSELGFGRPWPNRSAVSCELWFGINEFVEIFEAIYEECIHDLRADDKLTGEFEPPFPGATRYPSLPEFLAKRGPWFSEFVDEQLKFDILRKVFPEDDAARSAVYAVQVFEGIDYRPNAISFQFSAYPVEDRTQRSLVDQPIRWFQSNRPGFPFWGELEGHVLVIRENGSDGPARYTLLANGSEVLFFDGWPDAWSVISTASPTPPWNDLLMEPPEDFIFIHTDGLENAPDDPIGQNRLVLRGDGSALLENRKSGRVRRWTGRVDPTHTTRALAVLADMGFPDIPLRPPRPGPTLRWVQVMAGGLCETAVLTRGYSERNPPDSEFCKLVDVFIAQMSDYQWNGRLRGQVPEMVQELQELTPG